MSLISANVTLRPIRFAFLVRPDDKQRVHEIFKTNTCLWGGRFNPIIPFLKQVPTWWERHGRGFESAVQVVNGYLDAFEPDFLVEAEPRLADGLGFDESRILQLSDMLGRESEWGGGHGQSVFDVYRHLYKTDYQFVRRSKENIVAVSARQVKFRAFCACVFGAFPADEDLAYFSRGFQEAFDADTVTLTPDSFGALMSPASG